MSRPRDEAEALIRRAKSGDEGAALRYVRLMESRGQAQRWRDVWTTERRMRDVEERMRVELARVHGEVHARGARVLTRFLEFCEIGGRNPDRWRHRTVEVVRRMTDAVRHRSVVVLRDGMGGDGKVFVDASGVPHKQWEWHPDEPTGWLVSFFPVMVPGRLDLTRGEDAESYVTARACLAGPTWGLDDAAPRDPYDRDMWQVVRPAGNPPRRDRRRLERLAARGDPAAKARVGSQCTDPQRHNVNRYMGRSMAGAPCGPGCERNELVEDMPDDVATLWHEALRIVPDDVYVFVSEREDGDWAVGDNFERGSGVLVRKPSGQFMWREKWTGSDRPLLHLEEALSRLPAAFPPESGR